MAYARKRRFGNLGPESLHTHVEEEWQALETHLNSGIRQFIYIQDEDNQADPLDAWQIKIVNSQLRITFYDDSAGTTTNRLAFDPDGDIIFKSVAGPAAQTLLWDESDGRWEFVGNVLFGVDIQVDGGDVRDSAGVSRLGWTTGGNTGFRDHNGTNVLRWNQSAGELQADIGNGTFNKVGAGRLIAFGQAGSSTNISNPAASMNILSATQQTVACEYANQPVVVEATGYVTWINVSTGATYIINIGLNGSNYGTNEALSAIFEATGSAAPDVSGTSGTNSAPNSDVSVIGTSGAESAGTPHDHGSGTYVVDNNSFDHTHSDGSYAAASHTHTAVMTRLPMSVSGIISTTANGSGNITVSIYANGDGTADIEGWWIVYKVYEAV